MTDKHDRYHLDDVLQEASNDERPSKVQLLLDLNHYQAITWPSYLLNAAPNKGLLHAWHHT